MGEGLKALIAIGTVVIFYSFLYVIELIINKINKLKK